MELNGIIIEWPVIVLKLLVEGLIEPSFNNITSLSFDEMHFAAEMIIFLSLNILNLYFEPIEANLLEIGLRLDSEQLLFNIDI